MHDQNINVDDEILLECSVVLLSSEVIKVSTIYFNQLSYSTILGLSVSISLISDHYVFVFNVKMS